MSDFDDYNEDEWGNIGKPEDFKVSNHVLKWTKDKRQKKREEVLNRPQEWRDKQSELTKAHYNKPGVREAASKRTSELMDKIIEGEDITLREKIRLANIKSAKNPVHYQNRLKANQTRAGNPEVIQKLRNTCQELWGYEIKTPQGIYPSMNDWERDHGNGHRTTVSRHLKRLPHLYYKVADGPGDPTYFRWYTTPTGNFQFHKEAMQSCIDNGLTNLALRSIDYWWRLVCDSEPDKYGFTFTIADDQEKDRNTYTMEKIKKMKRVLKSPK